MLGYEDEREPRQLPQVTPWKRRQPRRFQALLGKHHGAALDPTTDERAGPTAMRKSNTSHVTTYCQGRTNARKIRTARLRSELPTQQAKAALRTTPGCAGLP